MDSAGSVISSYDGDVSVSFSRLPALPEVLPAAPSPAVLFLPALASVPQPQQSLLPPQHSASAAQISSFFSSSEEEMRGEKWEKKEGERRREREKIFALFEEKRKKKICNDNQTATKRLEIIKFQAFFLFLFLDYILFQGQL